MSEKSPVQPNLTKLRDDECIPIAREILKIVGNTEELVIGTSETYSEEVALEFYNKLYEEKIAPLLVEKNIRVKDITFIFQIAQQALQLLDSRVTATIDHNYDQSVAKLMEVTNIDDVRIGNIQNVLVEEQQDNKKE